MTARKRKLRPREMAKLWPSAAMVVVVWRCWRKGGREGGEKSGRGWRPTRKKKKKDNRGWKNFSSSSFFSRLTAPLSLIKTPFGITGSNLDLLYFPVGSNSGNEQERKSPRPRTAKPIERFPNKTQFRRK